MSVTQRPVFIPVADEQRAVRVDFNCELQPKSKALLKETRVADSAGDVDRLVDGRKTALNRPRPKQRLSIPRIKVKDLKPTCTQVHCAVKTPFGQFQGFASMPAAGKSSGQQQVTSQRIECNSLGIGIATPKGNFKGGLHIVLAFFIAAGFRQEPAHESV